MKIAVLFEASHSGGGSFTHSINTSSDLIKYLGFKNQIIIYTRSKKNFEILRKLRIPTVLYTHTFLDKILIFSNILKNYFFYQN